MKQRGNSLHLIGLLSEKSSHGSIDYPLALLGMAKAHGLEEVYLHMIIDGRSTEPGSAPVLLEKLEDKIAEIGIGKIVSGVGRGSRSTEMEIMEKQNVPLMGLSWGPEGSTGKIKSSVY